MSAAVRRGSFASVAAVILGVPLGLCAVIALQETELLPAEYRRYVEHPVEQAEVVLFCCGVLALGAKMLGWLRERASLRRQLLPAWNGNAIPVAQAAALRDHLAQRPAALRQTWLGRRFSALLDFVHSRGSALQLDDQLRTLADNDATELDASYSFLRFITWAIPILGFLGTVVGITAAVAGVTPETLEQSLSEVTGGLATAFDTTALALCLTMVLMFGSFLMERLESGVLQGVDACVDAELAHRFERTAPEASPIVEAMRTSAQHLSQLTEQLVQRQVALWSQSLKKADRQWNESGHQQIASVRQGIEHVLDAALQRQAQHLQHAEERFLARTEALLAGLAAAADKLGLQTHAVYQLQAQEAQLVRLQEALQQNLAALAGAGAFDQAVQSLTAAIHLLTMRVQATPPRLAA
jgi:biopolymer transport protein ExbB/TolQ